MEIIDHLQIAVWLLQEDNIEQLDYGHPKRKVIKMPRMDFWKTNHVRVGSFFSLLWQLSYQDERSTRCDAYFGLDFSFSL